MTLQRIINDLEQEKYKHPPVWLAAINQAIAQLERVIVGEEDANRYISSDAAGSWQTPLPEFRSPQWEEE